MAFEQLVAEAAIKKEKDSKKKGKDKDSSKRASYIPETDGAYPDIQHQEKS